MLVEVARELEIQKHLKQKAEGLIDLKESQIDLQN